MIGFSHYDVPPSTALTTQEILAALTGAQKTAVLNGFALKTPVTQLKHETSGIGTGAIRHLYRKIDEVEESARMLMRGASPPTTATALRNAIQDSFVDDFTSTQISAILNKMIQYAKHDGSGTFSYYKAEVIK